MPSHCERCERLEEELRQLRKLIAPQTIFPEEWNLTRREAQLLGALTQRSQVSRDQLFAALYPGDTGEGDIRVIDQFVRRIRRKMEAHQIPVTIKAIYGLGYTIPAKARKFLMDIRVEG